MKLKAMIAVGVSLICTQVLAETVTTTQTMQGQQPTTASSNAMPQSEMDKNKLEGQAFLKQNKTKPEVIELPDGLQYKIIKAGKGAKPMAADVVVVDYSGRFIDGKEFDSSSKHGGSAEFPVGQVIPGWTEAMQLMPVGSTWEIYVPSDLAYGDNGAPPDIAPGKTLIFTITLKSVKKSV